MTLPMILTVGRIILAPLFFIVYYWASVGSPFLVIAVWGLFIAIEVSDLLDGHMARVLKQESEIGKVLDPFADSLSRLAYFFSFCRSGFLPMWVLLFLVYRDIALSYVRVFVSGKGVMLAARLSGKIKAWVYGVCGGVGIAYFTLQRFGWGGLSIQIAEKAVFAVFLATVIIAVWTLVDYGVFLKNFFTKAS
jgi:CDP-diacylglycerol--glycerol-3-phosphate 3-phosphatidyltransferase